jgi:hypothetical protein
MSIELDVARVVFGSWQTEEKEYSRLDHKMDLFDRFDVSICVQSMKEDIWRFSPQSFKLKTA